MMGHDGTGSPVGVTLVYSSRAFATLGVSVCRLSVSPRSMPRNIRARCSEACGKLSTEKDSIQLFREQIQSAYLQLSCKQKKKKEKKIACMVI